MTPRKKVLPLFAGLLFPAFCLPVAAVAQTIPNGAAIDAEVSRIMTQTHAQGIAIAEILGKSFFGISSDSPKAYAHHAPP